MAYTTETKVRERNTNFGTDPPTANITNFIAHAKAIIDARALTTFTDAQAADTIVEQLATDIAAFYSLTWKVEAFTNSTEAALTANMLYELIDTGLKLLEDQRLVNMIKA